MVFIDNPVGTGFSYGEPLLTTLDEAGDEFVTFLSNFYEMYPYFVGHDLYLTGESFGGKYLPKYSAKLIEANERLASKKYNLRATLIGDPYTAPLTQRTNMHRVPEALNILDDSNMP
jgi:carboxypeptidase D